MAATFDQIEPPSVVAQSCGSKAYPSRALAKLNRVTSLERIGGRAKPAKVAPPSVVRTMARHVPVPFGQRADPSIHQSSRLAAVNQVGAKETGIG